MGGRGGTGDSELVTNAALHAHTEIDLRVKVFEDELCVEIRDVNPVLPVQCNRHGRIEQGARRSGAEPDLVTCRALIVDDDDDMRFLLTTTIEVSGGGLEVVAEASNASDGLHLWRTHRPDVVVLDYQMPHRDGVELAGDILAEDPGQVVILCSAFLDQAIVTKAAAVGIRECVPKDRHREIPTLLLEYCTESE